MAKIVDSLDPYRCSWCKEIRDKHELRYIIAKRLGLDQELIKEFYNLAYLGRCPFHRTSVLPFEDRRKTKVYVESKKFGIVITLKWWTGNYHYYLTFDMANKVVEFESNHYSAELLNISGGQLDFQRLLEETLRMMSLKDLKELLRQVKELEGGLDER